MTDADRIATLAAAIAELEAQLAALVAIQKAKGSRTREGNPDV